MSEKISMKLSIWISILIFLISLGAYAAYLVFTRGLAVTAMSNMVPWGLWITDYIWHIAVGSGAFMVCAAVYIFGMKKFFPIVRLAVLISLLDYVIGVVSLLPDLGAPERFWHVYIYPNFHSIFFEVILCITLYTLVLIMEHSGVVFEGVFKRPKLAVKAHKLAPPLAVAGAALSTLHQSSLGGVFSVIKAGPLVYSPDVPLIFILSAMAAGPAIIIFVAILTSKALGREVVEIDVLSDLGRVSMFFLIGYIFSLGWHIYQVNYHYLPLRSEFITLLGGTLTTFWATEIVLGGIVPIAILANPKTRKTTVGLLVASGLVLIGTFVHRWDTVVNSFLPTYMSAFSLSSEQLRLPLQPSLWTYFPTWTEWALIVGIIALWSLLYTLAIKFLPILPSKE